MCGAGDGAFVVPQLEDEAEDGAAAGGEEGDDARRGHGWPGERESSSCSGMMVERVLPGDH